MIKIIRIIRIIRLQMCLKILIKAGMLNQGDVNQLLKSGSGIDDRNKKFMLF